MTQTHVVDFAFGDVVRIRLNGKTGRVAAVSVYEDSPTQYSLHFIDGVGDAVYGWFKASDLELL